MPKIKTKRSAAKRFRITASGKIKRKKAYANHILAKKTRKRKRKLRQAGFVESSDESKVRRLIPYR